MAFSNFQECLIRRRWTRDGFAQMDKMPEDGEEDKEVVGDDDFVADDEEYNLVLNMLWLSTTWSASESSGDEKQRQQR